ncbi:O-antigen ligase family protein [Novosphingobium terrae]|uniref:O-antigen ligase family protein n=1 Tax=Novosphingobium terrae TaxID=2726189 RepID=UPI00197D9D99|nr:O-antigen ligase family protein [Novosphingobium terrae]
MDNQHYSTVSEVGDYTSRLPEPAARFNVSQAWQSFFLIYLCQVQLLFASMGSRLWIVGFLLVSSSWVIAHIGKSVTALRRNALIFALPLYYLLSSTWSIYPWKTLYSDAELFCTFVLVISIVAAPDRRAAVTGLALAYATYTIFSLIFGGRVFWEAQGETAFAGLGGGKNIFGHTSALTGITALCLLIWGWDRKQSINIRLLAFASFAGLYLVSAYAVVIARASGSIIALGFATAVFFIVLIAGRSGRSVQFLMFFVFVSMAIIFLFFGKEIQDSVTGLILQTFHKTPALSGRLYFWATADKIIKDNPIFGIGYDAFWTVGNPTAEGLWEMYDIPGKSGINFHNTMREIRVEGGMVGLFVVATTMATLIGKRVVRALATGDEIEALGVAIFVYYVSRILTESVALGIWQPDTVEILFFLTPSLALLKRNSRPVFRKSSEVD